jgi:glutamate--cysteine ligase catalytic subunit
LSFLADRSKGKVLTGAKFLRNYALNHPSYKQDSILTDEMIYDIEIMVSSLENLDSEARTALLGMYAKAGPQ